MPCVFLVRVGRSMGIVLAVGGKRAIRFRRNGFDRWVAATLVLALALSLFLPFVAVGEARATGMDSAVSAGLYDRTSLCHANRSGTEQPQDDRHGLGPLCPLCQVLGHHGAFAPSDAVIVTGPLLAAAQFPIPPPSVPADRSPTASPRLPRAPPAL